MAYYLSLALFVTYSKKLMRFLDLFITNVCVAAIPVAQNNVVVPMTNHVYCHIVTEEIKAQNSVTL